jgi:hypothetical protein
MAQLNLEVGPVTLGLNFQSDTIVSHFKEYFACSNSPRKADMRINIQFTGRGRFKEVPNSLFLTKKTHSKGFEAGNGLIKGKFNSKRQEWTFKVHPLLVEGDYTRVFEQILYQSYTSAKKDQKTALVHSSGVIKDGQGYLFVGPSEAGKSTVARLSSEYQVINDEINIVNWKGPVTMLEGTPFNGLFRDKSQGKAPLKGVFLLNQAPFHGVEKVSGGKAIKILANEIIPPIGLNEELDSLTYGKMIDAAQDIFKCVTFYRMDFLPDRGFWDILSSL